ncbi:related to 37S ribosomal protein S25, mitochondrial [Ramularia collo-cygni]|uniref:Small ribosomal subunit protein mS23 n=1 Tax=Ramularia collo-cygni TaxID=112498 RepID=A0A2D3V5L1_9PEZI|nr:related to 37S ribosomal protein S25, mitochondrial [Ramularia collo-cygni]CZT24656.1 related to 37S ribosomal protein S25, mitochondrial [Ramularia collo-cygni]
MGRHSFAAQNINKTSQYLLAAKRLLNPPPAFTPLATFPPSTRLVRPPKQRSAKPGSRRTSRLFAPLKIAYEEDRLRWEYFNDHPWELARPRIILESDGKDHQRWDWSLPLDFGLLRPAVRDGEEKAWDRVMARQGGRPINGEAVIQRQQYLMHKQSLSEAAAYDRARKELYRFRHAREIEQRVAREEALSTGAYFGPGPLQTGMHVEDQMYEQWKAWAQNEIQAQKALAGSAYTGAEEEVGLDAEGGEESAALEEVAGSVPGSRGGVTARGGAAVHA